MPRLIVQADDIGITHAVTLGILDGIDNGIVRATGLFTNRSDTTFAAARLRTIGGVDVGIDLNFVTGRPVLDPERIPGLVTETGRFRSSGEIRATHPAIGGDMVYQKFERDPFDPAETAAEARAQVARFVELMGRPPAYVHHHSLVSPVSDEVVRSVAAELDVPFVDDLYRAGDLPLLPNDWYRKPFPLADQANIDARDAIERLLPDILSHDVSLLIVHPGYVDAELLDISTYSIVRARDLQIVTSREVRELLREAGVELSSFTAEAVVGTTGPQRVKPSWVDRRRGAWTPGDRADTLWPTFRRALRRSAEEGIVATPTPTGRIVADSDSLHLVLSRTLPGSLREGWACITDPELTGRWIGRWEGTGAPGETVRIRLGFEADSPSTDVEILDCEAPRLLRVLMISDDSSWDIEMDLSSAGDGTELRFVHHRIAPAEVGGVGPGWEWYLDQLVASITGAPLPSFDDYFPAQRDHFERQLP